MADGFEEMSTRLTMMCLNAGADAENRLHQIVIAADEGRWPATMGNVAWIAYLAGQMDACGAQVNSGNVVSQLAEVMEAIADEDEEALYSSVSDLARELGREPPRTALEVVGA